MNKILYLSCLFTSMTPGVGWCDNVVTHLSQLPSPENFSYENFENIHLSLELVINQRPTGLIADVERKGERYFVYRDDLLSAGVVADVLPGTQEKLDITSISGVEVDYLQSSLQLSITVPPNWLPMQRFSAQNRRRFSPAKFGTGGLFNYSVFGVYDHESSQKEVSINHELRAFSEFGVLSTTGIFKSNLHRDVQAQQSNKYTRFDTRYEYVDQSRRLRFEVGDYIVRPLAWSQPVRMAGIQLSHDFSMRPDVVTAPLPAFYGEVTAPTTLDLFVNGLKTDSMFVGPGPFVINDIPMVSGAGEATVIATDAQGRRTAMTSPFFLSANLLKANYTSYNASFGALRRNYGNASNDYGDGAVVAAARHGMTNWLTLEAQTEAKDDLIVAGVGFVTNLFNMGTIDGAVRFSNYEQRASSYSVGYSYQSRMFSFAARTQVESEGFYTLSQTPESLRSDGTNERENLSRHVSQINVGARLNELGSLSGGYFDVQQTDSRSRILNVTYSRSLPFDINMSLSFNRNIGGEAVTLAQFSLPLSAFSGSAGLTMKRESDGHLSGRASVSRLAPIRGGWGINLAHDINEKPDNRKQADVTYRASWAEFRAGLNGTSGNYDYFAEMSGSVASLDGEIFPANNVYDSFAVVSTSGFEGVPVKYENQVVGLTDDDGYLLVPWAMAYYTAKYEIDPLRLPANAFFPTTEQYASIHSGYGYLLEFPIALQVALSMEVVDENDAYLPLGTYGQSDTGVVGQIGWDGVTYFEGRNVGEYIIFYPEGFPPCKVFITGLYQTRSEKIQTLGKQVCTKEQKAEVQL